MLQVRCLGGMENKSMTSNSPNSTDIQAFKKQKPEHELITLRDVAKLTGIPYKTLWRHREEIPGYTPQFFKQKKLKAYYVKSEIVEYLTNKPKRLSR